jgi:hypothetical protein
MGRENLKREGEALTGQDRLTGPLYSVFEVYHNLYTLVSSKGLKLKTICEN